MVTWGTNQVFPVPGSANTAVGGSTTPAFGAAPSPGGSTSSFFGAPSPTPAPAGGFFSSPAPAPGGSLFGASFGTTQAPSTTSSSLFGTPAPGGLFGTPAPTSLFGAPVPSVSTPQQPQIPAQAALQAHADATARQEAAKLQNSLEILHKSYSGITNSSSESSPFVSIIYNDMTPEQLQWSFAHSQAGSLAVPPQPPSVSEHNWLNAVVRNPDPSLYIPTALVGAETLQARLGWQQERANTLSQGILVLEETYASVDLRIQQYKREVDALERIHMGLTKRLLEAMRKVELVRCMNIPLQSEEQKLLERLQAMRRHIDEVGTLLNSVTNKAPTILQNVELPDKTALMNIFTGHRASLVQLSEVMQKDKRDMALIQERLLKPSATGLRH